jgi:hypothetical protein
MKKTKLIVITSVLLLLIGGLIYAIRHSTITESFFNNILQLMESKSKSPSQLNADRTAISPNFDKTGLSQAQEDTPKRPNEILGQETTENIRQTNLIKLTASGDSLNQTRLNSERDSIRKAGEYIKFLYKIQNITTKFLSNLSYSQEIEYISRLEFLPTHIQKLLDDMKVYDRSFSSIDTAKYEILFPKEKSLLEKIFKIKRKNEAYANIENLRIKISSELETLIEFAYSRQVQSFFLINTESE